MKNLLLALLLLISTKPLWAQQPRPEQDCMGAINLCQLTTVNGIVYSGYGISNSELPIGICLTSGEENSVWYTFTIGSPGILCFQITPTAIDDDYDFALFNLTGHDCSAIATGFAPTVRCNYALSPGLVTGIDTFGMGTTASAGGSVVLSSLQVSSGQKFALLINNFTAGGNAYTLGFEHSTCTFKPDITDTLRVLRYINNMQLDSSITVVFNRVLDCNSIDSTGADFQLLNAPAGFAISHVQPIGNCDSNGVYSVQVFFNQQQMDSGRVDLQLLPGSLSTVCSGTNALDSLSLNIHAQPPIADFGTGYNGNRIVITNQALYADTVYYYGVDSNGHHFVIHPNSFYLNNAGPYQLCQVAINNVGIDTFCTTYTYTGIDAPLEKTLSIYPNPTTGMLHVDLPEGMGTTKLRLMDILGKEVLATEVNNGQSSADLNLSDLPAATYLLYVEKGGKQTVVKVLKY